MLEEVFVGRRDEQDRFAALLRGLPSSKRPGVIARLLGRRARGGAADDAESRVVLVHGLAGVVRAGCFVSSGKWQTVRSLILRLSRAGSGRYGWTGLSSRRIIPQIMRAWRDRAWLLCSMLCRSR